MDAAPGCALRQPFSSPGAAGAVGATAGDAPARAVGGSQPHAPHPLPTSCPVAYFGSATDIGRRAYQEDLSLVLPYWPACTDGGLAADGAAAPPDARAELGLPSGALALLFDGHGGPRAAHHAAQHLPRLLARALRSRGEQPNAAASDGIEGEASGGAGGGVPASSAAPALPASAGMTGCAFARATARALGEVDASFCEWARRDGLHDGSTVLLALVSGCEARLHPSVRAAAQHRARADAPRELGAAAQLFVANIGDSRCVLGRSPAAACANFRRSSRSPSRAASVPPIDAVRLSRDHRPTDPAEKARILGAGGRVQMGRVGVDGCRMSLSVSRCLGDVELKDPPGARLQPPAAGRAGPPLVSSAHSLPARLPSVKLALAGVSSWREEATALRSGGDFATVAPPGLLGDPAASAPTSATLPAPDGAPSSARKRARAGAKPPPGGAAAAPSAAEPAAPRTQPPSTPPAISLGVISVEPHVTSLALSEADRFAVLGSDGLFDSLTDERVVRCVGEHLRAALARAAASPLERAPPPDGCALAQECAQALVKSALANGAVDNVTALVVLFDWADARGAAAGGQAAPAAASAPK